MGESSQRSNRRGFRQAPVRSRCSQRIQHCLSSSDALAIKRAVTADQTRLYMKFHLNPPRLSAMPTEDGIVLFVAWNHRKPQTQRGRPPNHKSSRLHAAAIRRHTRKGQRDGRYLVVDELVLTLWPELFISPVGVVGKGDDDTRMINDYSFRNGDSVNKFTDRTAFLSITYNPRWHLHDAYTIYAHDIQMQRRRLRGISARTGYAVIDLSSGFSWYGSPAFYSLAETLINDLYECTSVVGEEDTNHGRFHGNCRHRATSRHCQDSRTAAINDKKFTPPPEATQQGTRFNLGLIWDTATGSVSIPNDKLEKAKQQVASLISSSRATNVCVAFTRFLSAHTRCVNHQVGSQALRADVIEDLRWFQTVLANKSRFDGIPVAQFACETSSSVHIYMDASGTGLCIIEPQRREFIRVQYSSDELEELHSVQFVQHYVGGDIGHLQCLTTRRMCTSTSTTPAPWRGPPIGQTVQHYNRLLSFVEFEHNLAFTAEHIPGRLNVMQTRARARGPRRIRSGVEVPPPFDDLLNVGERLCAEQLSHGLLQPSTVLTGFNREIFQVHVLVAVVEQGRLVELSKTGLFRYLTLEVWREQYRSWQSVPNDTVERYVDVDLSRSPLLRVLLQGIKRLSDPPQEENARDVRIPFGVLSILIAHENGYSGAACLSGISSC
ncbi:hypothetical protein PHMEG_0007965 [Phytophthora megakarya]|uniref:Uncharacterized protein n=1 Tax=Phytophthora megakarya TaxID=4795 RepID=A0A225WLW7_9STRA|nr:hypothetical protein PHMEG_0007965 [Phytophthora megakarya]